MCACVAYPVLKSKVKELSSEKDETISGQSYTCPPKLLSQHTPTHVHTRTEVDISRQQLVSMLSVLLEIEKELATHSLGDSLKDLTLSLCRLPLFHEAAMTPAALKGGGDISTKILDQALMESEVGITV